MSLKNLLILAAISFAISTAHALPEPKDFREGAMRNPRLHNSSGEQFCWNARIPLEKILTAYEATKDPRWLDEAVTYFKFLESKITKDPDGFEGWIGDGIHDPTRKGAEPDFRTDALVGDAILLEHFVRFSEIVLTDPALMDKYGARAKAHIDLAKRIAWEKWNHRGAYYRDGAGYGSYHTHGKVIDADTGKWRPSTVISDNLNKHSAMAIVMLRLYRVTGEEQFRTRAIEIFSRLKNLFRYFPEDDRVSWNFWMPHGPYDVLGARLGSWVGVHPNRAGYQATEVERMVEAYDSGIVFDLADIQRLVNANHSMMPANNGGKWRSSDLSSDAGTLWSSLARFDPLIRKSLDEKIGANPKSSDDQISRAYFDNVTAKQDDKSRALLGKGAKVTVYDFPPRPGANLCSSVVIPSEIEIVNGDSASLVTQTKGNGDFSIDLVDASTGKILGRIDAGNASQGITIGKWDGTNPATSKKTPGDYLLRWTLGKEVRDEIVRVIPGTKREKQELNTFPNGVAKNLPFPEKLLSPGQKLEFDFADGKSDGWILNNAEITSSLPGGRKGSGLKISDKQSASLIFGNSEEGLPVRIVLSVFDAGDKYGAKNLNGSAWGVFGNDGEFYGPALFWRKYLGTDGNHAWINTVKDGWLSPQYARIPRKAGWHEWIFDFTDSAAAAVMLDGKKVAFPTGGLPDGATGISLRGGADKSALFVTDVKVERK